VLPNSLIPEGQDVKLTNESVARLRLSEGKLERLEFDDLLPGFGIRLRAGGKRTWVVQFRVGTKQRRMTIGTPQTLDAAEARRRAREALSKVHLGQDPQAQKAEAQGLARLTLGSVVELYLPYAASQLKPRSYTEVERHLRRHMKPLAGMTLAKVSRAAVAARLNVIARERGPIAANRARASLSTLFSWAIGEGLADANPVVGTNKACAEIARDRVLSDGELRLIWHHAGDDDYGAIVRLLLLTGQRREEVGGMAWGELDLGGALWSIEGERTKNRRSHEVPLSSAALNILEAQPKREGRELVFGSGAGPFSGWSKARAALDTRIAAALREQGKETEIAPWRLHDLRRTTATGMANLGTAPHVVEAVLNHISGHRAGVAGVYNRAVYAREMRAALSLWGAHITSLTGSGNVVPLKRTG
jgi:integrase